MIDTIQTTLQYAFAGLLCLGIGFGTWKITARLRRSPPAPSWSSRTWISRGLRMLLWAAIGLAIIFSGSVLTNGYQFGDTYALAKSLAVFSVAGFFTVAALALAYRTWPGLFKHDPTNRLTR